MGLMDRVKQQASQLAQQANESMSKLDNLPAQRRADSLLRSLGVAVLADKTGRAAADNDAQITRILADIEQHERQYNVDLVQQAAQAAQAQQMQQQPWQPGPPGQPGQQGQPAQPGQPGQPGQQGQPWQQPPGDFLTSAPPVGQNVPSAPGPGQGGAPGYGGAGAGPGGQPMPGPSGWNQQGGQIGSSAFPPSGSFPGATPDQAPDAEDEPGQQNFFPPASGV